MCHRAAANFNARNSVAAFRGGRCVCECSNGCPPVGHFALPVVCLQTVIIPPLPRLCFALSPPPLPPEHYHFVARVNSAAATYDCRNGEVSCTVGDVKCQDPDSECFGEDPGTSCTTYIGLWHPCDFRHPPSTNVNFPATGLSS